MNSDALCSISGEMSAPAGGEALREKTNCFECRKHICEGQYPNHIFGNISNEAAGELIKQGALSITEISLHCNFPDLFTFSKAFKRRYGISPSRMGER